MGLREILSEVIENKWPDTKVVEYLGHGAYGYVFRCVKEDDNVNVKDEEAVKIIPIPMDDMEIDDVRRTGKMPEQYFRDQLDSAVNEIEKLVELKSPHIVHINRYASVKQDNGVGWYLLFSMDLLEDLRGKLDEHIEDDMTQAETMAKKVAMDICSALEVCEEANEVHRDIKPENIFVSKRGDYYLGDFGIARKIVSNITNLSSRGTEIYVAPEVRTMKYDGRADIYSLGLLLYQIVNHGRLPFYPNYPDEIRASHENEAQQKRLLGEVMPFPDNCSQGVGNIVLKMCAFNPEDRYKSAGEVINAIQALDNPHIQVNFTAEQTNNINIMSISTGDGAAYSNHDNRPVYNDFLLNKTSRKINPIMIYSAIGAFLLICLIVSSLKFVKLVKNVANKAKSNYTTEMVVQSEEDNTDLQTDEIQSSISNIESGGLNDESAMAVKLSSMEIVESNHEITRLYDSAEDTLGNQYNNVLCIEYYLGRSYAKYYLGGKYKRFKCNYACEDKSNNGDYQLKIYGDDENDPLYLLNYTRALPVTQIDIDVTGVEFITFELTSRENGYGGIVSDGIFYVDEPDDAMNSSVNEEAAHDTKLSSMEIVESNHEITRLYDSAEDTLGNQYNNVLCIEYYLGRSYAKYYLGGKYKRFKCNYACEDKSNNGDYQLKIYGDDENDPLYLLNYTRALPVTQIDIDVTGVEFITFELTSRENGYGGIVSDGIFYVK